MGQTAHSCKHNPWLVSLGSLALFCIARRRCRYVLVSYLEFIHVHLVHTPSYFLHRLAHTQQNTNTFRVFFLYLYIKIFYNVAMFGSQNVSKESNFFVFNYFGNEFNSFSVFIPQYFKQLLVFRNIRNAWERREGQGVEKKGQMERRQMDTHYRHSSVQRAAKQIKNINIFIYLFIYIYLLQLFAYAVFPPQAKYIHFDVYQMVAE